MANTFNNSAAAAVGLIPVIVYQTDANTKATVIGVNVANLSEADPVEVDVILELADTSQYFIAKKIVIPPANVLAVVGSEQKIVMTESNKLSVSATTASSVDVIVSVLEIT